MSQERLKNVSPGALRQLQLSKPSKEVKWSLQKRMEMIAGLDLKRLSNEPNGGVPSTADPRRTVKVAARVRGLSREERKAHAKRGVAVRNGNKVSVVKSDVFADAEAEAVAAAAEIYNHQEWGTTFTFDTCL